ncbi:MAG TPA: alpha/beta hydrolase fold domain-containing protein, partial [Gemmatimonadales bacterium]|nr:alpha/beta hydrolase fold domain-containing protein [Gemmatimonadales bacterium]
MLSPPERAYSTASRAANNLTLAGQSYATRADAEFYFTQAEAVELTRNYVGAASPKHPSASPLHAGLNGLPPVRVHVGDAEVLLDDSRRYVERAVAAGVDAKLDVWMGMPHGFALNIGVFNASKLALEACAAFFTQRFELTADQ